MVTEATVFTEAQELAYKAGLVRFYQGNKVVGAGFYVNPGYVLTCAHVVTQCLSLGTKPQGISAAAVAGKPIKVDFPFVAREQFQDAAIVPTLWQLQNQDLAVLKISQDIPSGVNPLPYLESAYYRQHRYHIYGFPDGHPGGIWTQGEFLGELIRGWIQMEDTKTQGVAIEPGFSGAPVWDETLAAIVGMTVARDSDRPDAKVGFMIPYPALKPALEAITLFDLLLPEADQLVSQWQTAYRLLRPEHSTEPLATTLQEAIVQVQDMSPGNSAYRAIEQFVGYLALPELGLLLQPSLLQWLQKCLKPQDAPLEILLDTMRQKVAAQKAKQPETLAPHLLFWVQEALNSDRFFAQAYLILNREHYNPETQTGVQQLKELAQLFEQAEDEKVSQPQLEEAIQLCLNESVEELVQEQDDFPPIRVEVFLSRRCLSWQVDQWLTDEKTRYNPNPESIGSRYRLVLRVVDRLDERLCTRQMKALWKKKWSSLEKNQGSLAVQGLVRGDHQEPDTLSIALLPDEVVGWHRYQPPQPVAESDPCAFSVMVGTGAPVAIWLRQPLPNESSEFSQLLQSGLAELPASVSQLRKEAHHRSDRSSPHIGENIGLIWDDPKLVPPGAVKPKRLRMSA